MRDFRLLFTTRMVRLFAYGFLAVVLVLYLTEISLSERRIGWLLTLTLLGDTLISLGLTTTADRWGRKRTLLIGAVLMIFAGVLFVATHNFWLLLAAATIGVISPSGNEVGPFLSVEQAALTQLIPAERRTAVFAWYNLAGSGATAFGSLAGGWLTQLAGAQSVLAGYSILGGVLVILFWQLSPSVETATPPVTRPLHHFGLHRSRGVVFRLSALFSLDAFAGGFVVQSLVAYWFHVRYGVSPALLGSIFFGANLLAAGSTLAAARVAARFGLINTMVFTHLPSNILLLLVPFMPNLAWAIGVLLARFSISQMDVPTRQSYTMAVVAPDERSAAAGVTGIARTVGAALAPVLAGPILASGAIFYIAGGLKIAYDLLLYRSFQTLRPPEETDRPTSNG